MSDDEQWMSWLTTLDDVRPTPPEVKERIRDRVLIDSGDGAAPTENPARSEQPRTDPTGSPVEIDLRERIERRSQRRSRSRLFAGLAAAAGVLLLPNETPRASPTPEALDELEPAFADFVDELRIVGFDDLDSLERWEQLSRNLQQMGILVRAGEVQRADAALEAFRADLFTLAGTSSNQAVQSCFADWYR